MECSFGLASFAPYTYMNSNWTLAHWAHRALTILCVVCAVASLAQAQTPTQAIKAKDGAACAASFDDAVRVNIRPECVRELAPIVAAIRYAENDATLRTGARVRSTVSCILGSSPPTALRLGGVLLLSRRTMTDG